MVCKQREAAGLQCEPCRTGAPAPVTSPEPAIQRVRTHDPARADVLEDEEQQSGVSLLISLGWRVWRLGQHDARETQDPGPGDVYAVHVGQRRVLWWEAKRPDGGVQSDEQVEFGQLQHAVGVPYVCGALPALKRYLGI